MPLHDDIEAHLNSLGPYATSGTTFPVQKYILPDTPDACIVIEDFPAGKSIRAMGASLASPVRDIHGLMITVRGPQRDYAAAQTIADAVHAKLDGLSASLSGRRYYIQALNAPHMKEQDRNARWKLEANYMVWKERG